MLKTMKHKVQASSMSLKKSIIVCLIAFPTLIMVTLMYQNSFFGQFEKFSKGMTMGGMTHKNVTSEGSIVTPNDFGLRQNVTHDNFGGSDKNDTNFKSKYLYNTFLCISFSNCFHLTLFTLSITIIFKDQNSI
jgi:hypothetical protein